MATLSLTLSANIVAGLDRAAKARKKTRAAYVREVLTRNATPPAETAAPSLLDRSRNVCGIGNSGLGDLASNPEHLSDFGR